MLSSIRKLFFSSFCMNIITQKDMFLAQPSKLNFSFSSHLATDSLGLVAKGFF